MILENSDSFEQPDDEAEPFEKRSEEEVAAIVGELIDKVWYNRHQDLKQLIEEGKETCDPQIWRDALKAAKKIEDKYGEDNLGPYDDFEWGMLNGKLSALRWLLGYEWDMLDT
ncbi:MAG: hypothetical protein ABSG82_06630 [Sedimentisphaerales bacterium]